MRKRFTFFLIGIFLCAGQAPLRAQEEWGNLQGQIIEDRATQKKTYRNEILGCSFSVPHGWAVLAKDSDPAIMGASIVFVQYNSIQYVVRILMHHPENQFVALHASIGALKTTPFPEYVHGYYRAMSEKLRGHGHDVKVLGEESLTLQARAIRRAQLIQIDDTWKRTVDYWFEKGGRVYLLSFDVIPGDAGGLFSLPTESEGILASFSLN